MKNWQTTAAGVLAAVALGAEQVSQALATHQPIHWLPILGCIALALLGIRATDAKKVVGTTGGNVQ